MRHSAVVMANTEEEALKLAADYKGPGSDRVLFGSVGDWEAPDAYELSLPKGWKIVQEEPERAG